MLFISPEDFFAKASEIQPISRQEETAWALRMRAGDEAGRETLITAYLPLVAGCIKRLDVQYQTLDLVLRCCAALEKAVDKFNFLQDGESFSHRLSWCMRQTIVGYIADR